jgi:hypothetical protein
VLHWTVPAEEDAYDGVPYGELRFEEVDWSEAVEHVRDRRGRSGRAGELDIEPEWATEALAGVWSAPPGAGPA